MERIVSEGTLKASDLIPAFEGALRSLDPVRADTIEGDYTEVFAALAWGNREAVDRTDLREDAGFLVDELIDALNDALPGDYFFGTAEGDGALFGIWSVDSPE